MMNVWTSSQADCRCQKCLVQITPTFWHQLLRLLRVLEMLEGSNRDPLVWLATGSTTQPSFCSLRCQNILDFGVQHLVEIRPRNLRTSTCYRYDHYHFSNLTTLAEKALNLKAKHVLKKTVKDQCARFFQKEFQFFDVLFPKSEDPFAKKTGKVF